MTTRVCCPWCHALVTVLGPRQECPSCGHRADVARLDCDCPPCRGRRDRDDDPDDGDG